MDGMVCCNRENDRTTEDFNSIMSWKQIVCLNEFVEYAAALKSMHYVLFSQWINFYLTWDTLEERFWMEPPPILPFEHDWNDSFESCHISELTC